VKRSDSEACWRVQLGAAVAGDPAGGPAQTGDPATDSGATGDQQANDFPAAPVGPVAVENAIRAAVDDVGMTVRRFEASPTDRAKHPDARAEALYWATIDDFAGITVWEYDSPDKVRITANTDQDMPWAFHELTAYQCDLYWSQTPLQTRFWKQGSFEIQVQYPNSAAASYAELPEALWRRFGGGTGPGTPTSPLYVPPADPNDLPFGTKADIQTGN
jgi:hypothetical protein